MNVTPNTPIESLTSNEAMELFSGRRFNSYSKYFRRLFSSRVQKVAINVGLGCPNRDGTIGNGGCTFCINEAFTPSYCSPSLSVTEQIDEGIKFHRHRYPKTSEYLAYFQSYSNTYATLSRLEELYSEALAHPKVVGIIVGTRPDCVDAAKLDLLATFAQKSYVALEFGVESCYDGTLERINRGHSFHDARQAIEQSAQRGIHTGAHFILGLPDESDEALIQQVDTINSLPLTTIKFHQLQIFKGTAMAEEYEAHPERFRFWSKEEYISLFISILERLRPDLIVERFASEAPPRYHYGPNWGTIRNESLLTMLERELERRDSFQGRLYKKR